MFRRSDESYECECGGRTCSVPSILTKHQNTQRHRNWLQWKTLCCRLIEETSQMEKRKILQESKQLVRLVY